LACFASGFGFFFGEFAVAVLVEFGEHFLAAFFGFGLHGFAGGLAFVFGEFAVAVLIELLEHGGRELAFGTLRAVRAFGTLWAFRGLGGGEGEAGDEGAEGDE
jgi:hypothetical protein